MSDSTQKATRNNQSKRKGKSFVKIKVRTLQSGSYSGVTESVREVITDAVRWQQLWRSHTSNMRPGPKLPDIDFSKEIVVAVFLGQQASGGYGIEVTKVERFDGKTYIYCSTFVPDDDAGCITALTQCHHLVVIPRWDGPVTFVETSN